MHGINDKIRQFQTFAGKAGNTSSVLMSEKTGAFASDYRNQKPLKGK